MSRPYTNKTAEEPTLERLLALCRALKKAENPPKILLTGESIPGIENLYAKPKDITLVIKLNN